MSPWLLAGLAGAQSVASIIGAERQAKHNKELAGIQHSQNLELLKYQLDYNSPAAQMARFKAAGLNPHLIYGQGSPGNWDQSLKYPDIQPANYQQAIGSLGMIGEQFMRMKLMESQADLTNQKVAESGVKMDLQKAQTNLINSNPFMRKEYVDAIVLQLESAAKLKAQEADFMTQGVGGTIRIGDSDYISTKAHTWTNGTIKMQQELQNLYQQFQLNKADAKVKAEVIQSKEFQNAILEVQKKFLTDGEISPQHIYQFIMLLLTKMM